MGLEILCQAGIEVSYNYTYADKGQQLDLNKVRILRQANDHKSVYLVIGYEAKGNDLLFDDPL